jgi:hypothetical protein
MIEIVPPEPGQVSPDIAEWLRTRPECVQKLAREFPVHSSFLWAGKVYHVLGWTDEDELIVTTVDYDGTDELYDEAMKTQELIDAKHLRLS